jgi:HPt (histidine-containing phosphotransfer) domain-containing protein
MVSKPPGFDVQTGVERFGGDEAIYHKILASYAQNTPPLLEKLRVVTEERLAEYAITAHGLKGASRSICAEEIGARAEALERAAKAGDFAFVEANNAAFLQATEDLIAQIGDFLSGE